MNAAVQPMAASLAARQARVRLPGWELRLAAVLDAAMHKSYVLGQHDCFRLTCLNIEALTGIDRWPEWEGRYSTRREALALVAQHGSTFNAAFDWFFGDAHRPAAEARDGDIVKLIDETGEAHLGICVGGSVACLRERGLDFTPLSNGHCCWRVG